MPPNVQASKTGKDDDSLLEAEEGEETEGQEKAKRRSLSLFDITTMIHPRAAAARASAGHLLSNGAALMAPPDSTKDQQKKVNFVTDGKKFGFFHKQPKTVSAEPSASQIYSISEEVARQQVEEQLDEAEEVEEEEEELVVNCELNIHSPGEKHTAAPRKGAQNKTVDSEPGEVASSAHTKDSLGQDSELLTPKDLLDKELDFSRDCAGKQETITQDNYITTRL